MKKLILLFISILAIACSDGAPSELAPMGGTVIETPQIAAMRAERERELAEIAASFPAPRKFPARPQRLRGHDPSTVFYTATAPNANPQVTQIWMPSWTNTGAVCYLTWVQGANGYAGIPLWPNGMPQASSSWYYERWRYPNVVSAHWLEDVGAKITQAACTPVDDFNDAFVVQVNQQFYNAGWANVVKYSWHGQGPFTDNIDLGWDADDSFCYPAQFEGLTHGGTAEYTYRSGATWRFVHAGSAASYGGHPNCVHLSRTIPWQNSYVAYTNQPAWMDSSNQSICFITGIWGDLNNGAVLITATNELETPYRLSVSGAVWGATAHCVPYWDEAIEQ